MMTNLFSIFDPCSSSWMPNWTSSFLMFTMVPSSFWFMSNRSSSMFKMFFKTFSNELKLFFNTNQFKGATLMFSSLFILIIFINFLSLFPYIFSASGHLTMAFSLAFPMWVYFIMLGWYNNTNKMFAHLVPLNTPSFLMPFMVLIETVSSLIRPGTLSIRLVANMIAGHLLLSLLSNQTSLSPNMFILSLLLLAQILLLLLESAVACIQAYVFTILASLYSTEI